MICNLCGSTEVLQLYESNEIRFECINGHIWHEKYIDEGGNYERPSDFEYNFEDLLFPHEKEVYYKILDEVLKKNKNSVNTGLFDRIRAVIKNSNVPEEEAEALFNKIVFFNPKRML